MSSSPLHQLHNAGNKHVRPIADRVHFHFLANNILVHQYRLGLVHLKTLEAGKIVLVPDRLWINVLEYTPKSAEDTKVESHQNMIDLQYTFEGNELMGLADKVVVTEEYNPVKDVTKYRADGEVSYVPAGPDRFFLYFPSDMHQPSVQAPGEVIPSRKIVGKIEYAK